MTTPITIRTTINAPVAKVWQYWTEPEHITKWNAASDDWHTTHAENDLRVEGSFTSRMEAKDGSMGFDFGGVYTEVEQHVKIAYNLGDERKVVVEFKQIDDSTTEVVETFDPESENPREMQEQGWQSILNNFKRYVEMG